MSRVARAATLAQLMRPGHLAAIQVGLAPLAGCPLCWLARAFTDDTREHLAIARGRTRAQAINALVDQLEIALASQVVIRATTQPTLPGL